MKKSLWMRSSPGMARYNAEECGESAGDEPPIFYRASRVFRAGRILWAEPIRVEYLHHPVIRRQCSLVDHDQKNRNLLRQKP